MATARCPDGNRGEAIESVHEDWFAVGTQFHPESDSASALDLRVFEEFLAGVTGGYRPSAAGRLTMAGNVRLDRPHSNTECRPLGWHVRFKQLPTADVRVADF